MAQKTAPSSKKSPLPLFSTKFKLSLCAFIVLLAYGGNSFYESRVESAKKRIRVVLKTQGCALGAEPKIDGTTITYRDGNNLFKVQAGYSKNTIDKIGKFITAIEDRSYWNGSDDQFELLRTILSVAKYRWDSGKWRGGSGIENQLFRMNPLSGEDCLGTGRATTPLEKFSEFANARALTEAMTELLRSKRAAKQSMLQTYFHNVPLGPVNGWPAAANYYFGRTVDRLSVSQIVALLLMTTNSKDFKVGKTPYVKDSAAFKRYNLYLKVLYDQDIISEPEYSSAINNPPSKEGNYEDLSKVILTEAIKRAASGSISGTPITNEDIKIESTISEGLQTSAKNTLSKILSELSKSKSRYGGSILVFDSISGQVLARVGQGSKESFDYAGEGKFRWNSVMKLVVAWAYLNVSPQNSLQDIIVDGKENSDGDSWLPANADGKTQGSITIEQALVRSRNIAFVKLYRSNELIRKEVARILLEYGGIVADTQHDSFPLGFQTSTPTQIGRILSAMATGTLKNPTLINDIRGLVLKDDGTESIESIYQSELPTPIDDTNSTNNALTVLRASRGVIHASSGTAYQEKRGKDLWEAGKTGSAEGKDGATFVYFRGDGTIVVAVINFEGGNPPKGSVSGGKTLAPKILELVDQMPNLRANAIPLNPLQQGAEPPAEDQGTPAASENDANSTTQEDQAEPPMNNRKKNGGIWGKIKEVFKKS